MQAQLQNQVHSQRQRLRSVRTGQVTQWKPTKDNLAEIETSFTAYCAAMRNVEKEPVQDIMADYAAKCERDAAKAQPRRRKPYDAAAAASKIVPK